ncbi:arylsulfatase [Algoriphagus machipongonensis]|uniref:Cerebroside-sulfatase n=1 Tax=Algoriphagus machipongonensis TaxID=388413 RepID=A3HSW7_9BACT|nr:arylsulfatase [Algoriphagus machipongonensis]EAZ82935.1 Cerebroside-sulfatase [Algoriphagus machipongonensis]
MKICLRLLQSTLLIFCFACSGPEKPIQKPNIILIYADDLGIGLLGHEGQNIIKTPNIDRIAAEGVRFTRAYSNMLCAPARASLITGHRDTHEKGFEITQGGIYLQISKENLTSKEVEKKINNVLSPIPDEQVFLAEIAKSAGYVTGQVGKLEWGFSATDQQMKRHGWDYYFGYLDHQRAHGFYPPFLFENGNLVEIEGNTLPNAGKSGEPETEETYQERWDMEGKKSYSQDVFMEKVLGFIDNHQDQAFLLYFPTQLPHGPVSIPAVHEDFINDNRLTQIEKEYASMVKLLDENVGEILKKLEELGLEENTIVIFTSDNGHEIYYSQEGRTLKPYTNMETGERFDDYERKYYSDLAGDIFDGNGGRAGLKRSNLQGGINVPLLIKWPQKIAKGTSSDRLVANYDLLPTIAELVSYNKPFETDGKSFLNELLGKENSTENDFVAYSSFIGPTLIANDGWKIRTHLGKEAFELYYLPDDFKEENDLSQEFPEKLEELKNKLIRACDGDLNNGLYSSRNSQITIR